MRNMLSQESFEAADKFALSLAKKHKGTSKEASCYVNRGNLFYFTGQINEAIEAYNRAIEIAKKDKQTTDVALANNNKAGCHTQLGEYTKALEAIEEARLSFITLNNTMRVVNTYLVKGNIYYAQDILDEAMLAYETGLELLADKPDSHLKGSLYNNMALIFNQTKPSSICGKTFEYFNL